MPRLAAIDRSAPRVRLNKGTGRVGDELQLQNQIKKNSPILVYTLHTEVDIVYVYFKATDFAVQLCKIDKNIPAIKNCFNSFHLRGVLNFFFQSTVYTQQLNISCSFATG